MEMSSALSFIFLGFIDEIFNSLYSIVKAMFEVVAACLLAILRSLVELGCIIVSRFNWLWRTFTGSPDEPPEVS